MGSNPERSSQFPDVTCRASVGENSFRNLMQQALGEVLQLSVRIRNEQTSDVRKMPGRGARHFRVSGTQWKKSCLGLHIKYTNTNKNKKISCFKQIYDFLLGYIRNHPELHVARRTQAGHPWRGFCFIESSFEKAVYE